MADTAQPTAVALDEATVAFRVAGDRVYTAVERASLSVAHGEFVAIVGPTGCGKSTLLNVAAGLLKPAAGSIKIFDQPLTGLRTQICNLLKGAPDFNEQTTTNKIFRCPSAAVHSAGGDRWILTAWERCGRAWGNEQVPCIHADPELPDCAPGETVRVRGRLWFYEGKDIAAEMQRSHG